MTDVSPVAFGWACYQSPQLAYHFNPIVNARARKYYLTERRWDRMAWANDETETFGNVPVSGFLTRDEKNVDRVDGDIASLQNSSDACNKSELAEDVTSSPEQRKPTPVTDCDFTPMQTVTSPAAGADEGGQLEDNKTSAIEIQISATTLIDESPELCAVETRQSHFKTKEEMEAGLDQGTKEQISKEIASTTDFWRCECPDPRTIYSGSGSRNLRRSGGEKAGDGRMVLELEDAQKLQVSTPATLRRNHSPPRHISPITGSWACYQSTQLAHRFNPIINARDRQYYLTEHRLDRLMWANDAAEALENVLAPGFAFGENREVNHADVGIIPPYIPSHAAEDSKSGEDAMTTSSLHQDDKGEMTPLANSDDAPMQTTTSPAAAGDEGYLLEEAKKICPVEIQISAKTLVADLPEPCEE
ncbi:hypothetical protein HK102_007442 [Quaeritorhiza haematococci]|nr:hypothetical protein HK102_007442 [Quaeritorhiza haematococci]